MSWFFRITLLIGALAAMPAVATTPMPERDKATWSQIDTSGKVVKSNVGEYFRPEDEAKPAPGRVVVRNTTVDGHTVFHTEDAQNHHVLGTFPPDLILSYSVDESGLVVVVKLKKNQYGINHLVYGYAKITGEMVVEPQYDEAGQFASNGLALVEKDHKSGFVGTDGKERIPLEFSAAKAFGEKGLAPVRTSAGWGYIDATGNFVIPPHFENAKAFGSNDLAPASDGHWGYIDRTGTFVIRPQFDDAWPFWKDSTALVKLAGKERTFLERNFGPWTLKGIVTPAPDHPYFGPDPWAYVTVTGQSEDGLVVWTFNTHGEGLTIESRMTSSNSRMAFSTIPDFPATDSAFADALVANVELFFGENPTAGSAYEKELAKHRADLVAALAAMRQTSTDLWGRQSKPCLPPDCVY